jgi:hypothetical protein
MPDEGGSRTKAPGIDVTLVSTLAAKVGGSQGDPDLVDAPAERLPEIDVFTGTAVWA